MRILVASTLDSLALQELSRTHDVLSISPVSSPALKKAIVDREALIFRSGVSITSDILSQGTRLKLIIRAGCGLDNVDMEYVRQHGIELRTIPEPAALAVAEMTFALMLGLARRLCYADHSLRQGHWLKHEIEGHLLYGKTLGVLGAGNIGSRVGQLGAAFGMAVVGCVERPSVRVKKLLQIAGIQLANFDEVISSADFLSINLPLTESTRNLVNAAALARMKPGSFLINTARGGIVDEAALYRELANGGQLKGAALDVHQYEGEGQISPLASLPNVLLTPHIGSMTIETQREIGRRVLEIVDSFKTDQFGRDNGDAPVNSLSLEKCAICETD